MSGTFCTAINCMDGRVQIPVIRHLQQRWGVDHVDVVTEPGPVKAVAEEFKGAVATEIRRRVDVSRTAHGSTRIAVVAHQDCAGNPVTKTVQRQQLREAVRNLEKAYPDCDVMALWVDADGHVSGP